MMRKRLLMGAACAAFMLLSAKTYADIIWTLQPGTQDADLGVINGSFTTDNGGNILSANIVIPSQAPYWTFDTTMSGQTATNLSPTEILVINPIGAVSQADFDAKFSTLLDLSSLAGDSFSLVLSAPAAGWMNANGGGVVRGVEIADPINTVEPAGITVIGFGLLLLGFFRHRHPSRHVPA